MKPMSKPILKTVTISTIKGLALLSLMSLAVIPASSHAFSFGRPNKDPDSGVGSTPGNVTDPGGGGDVIVITPGPGTTQPADPVLMGAFDLANVSYGGTGCPAGQAPNIINNLGTSGELIFETIDFVASSNGSIARSNCQLAIPTLLPADKRLVVLEAELLGEADLDQGAGATTSLETWIGVGTGRAGAKEEASQSAASGSLQVPVQVVVSTPFESKCGAIDIFRVAAATRVSGAAGFSKVDSIRFKFEIQDCP